MPSERNRIAALLLVFGIGCACSAHAADYKCPGPDCVLDQIKKPADKGCAGLDCREAKKSPEAAGIKGKKAKEEKKIKMEKNATVKGNAAGAKYAPSIGK